MDDGGLQFLEVGTDRRRLAMRRVAGRGPTVFWCGGFKSDMTGTKAAHLADWAARTGRGFVRFDYSGHGESAGRFEDGTISGWLADARAVFDTLPPGKVLIVGSSMGGWISLLLARALRAEGLADRLAGLVLLAPAPDFTEALLWAAMSPQARQAVETDGVWLRPSTYPGDEAYPITRGLIEDGRRNLLLDRPLEIGCPVRILQGIADPDVPWSHAMRLVSCLAQDDTTITLIKDGDHRLSRPEDLDRLVRTIETFEAV